MVVKVNPPAGTCEEQPPDGFYCTREFHHNGPCALVPMPDHVFKGLKPMPGTSGVYVEGVRTIKDNPGELVKDPPGPANAGMGNFLTPEYKEHLLAVRPSDFQQEMPKPTTIERSGGPTSYYLCTVDNPNQGAVPYQAECGDIIEALGMDFNEGCEFKAIWRTAAARTLGKLKDGGDAKYDAEKRVFYAKRSLAVLTGEKPQEPPRSEELMAKAVQQRVTNLRRLLQALVDHKRVEPIYLNGFEAELQQLSKLV